jgi:hypothetical protein
LPEKLTSWPLHLTTIVCHEKIQSDGRWADTTSWVLCYTDTQWQIPYTSPHKKRVLVILLRPQTQSGRFPHMKAVHYSNRGPLNYTCEGITKHYLFIPFISSVQRTSAWGSYGTSQNYSSVLLEMSQTKLDENDILKLIKKHKDMLESIIEKEPAEAYEKTRNHLLDT